MATNGRVGDTYTCLDGRVYHWDGKEWLRMTNTPRATDDPGSRDRTPIEPPCGGKTAAQLSAKHSQVGGTHYKDMAIQPFAYIYKNNIGHLEGTAIGYLSRWRSKGGIEDLEKAVHAIQYLIEMEKGGA